MVDGVVIGQFLGVDSIAAFGIISPLMLFLLIFSGPVTKALGASRNTADLLPKARAYLIGVSFGLPAMNLVRVLNGFMPLDNDRNLPVISSIFLTASDIVMDLAAVLIFHGDTFEMGVATSISYYVALGVLLTHFLKKDRFLHLDFKSLPWDETNELLGRGMPSGVCRMGNTVRCIHIGLRMIAGIAKDIRYTCVLKLNNIFVRL